MKYYRAVGYNDDGIVLEMSVRRSNRRAAERDAHRIVMRNNKVAEITIIAHDTRKVRGNPEVVQSASVVPAAQVSTGGSRPASTVNPCRSNPRRKSMRDFIREHRAELDECIHRLLPGHKLNDEERRLWVLNDEGLYNWARSEGVSI
jgi:hypothetical protein